MDIERGQVAHHQAGPGAPQRQSAFAKAQAQAAAGGDFLALMATLEDGIGLPAGEVLGLLADGGDTGAGTGTGGARRRDMPDAAAGLLDPAAAGTAALLLGASAVAAPDKLPAATGSAAARLDGAAAAPAVPVPAEPVAAAANARVGAGAGASTAPNPAAAVSVDPRTSPQLASVFEQLRQHLAARDAAASEAATASSASSASAAAPSAATALAAGQREVLRAERGVALSLGGATRPEAAAVSELAAVSAATGGGRSAGQDAAGDGDAGQPGGAPAGAAWAKPEFTPTVQYDAALSGLDSFGAQAESALEQQVADQLRHWASQGVHSAEMTVGTSEPVQVRIALDGNEAQVQFRAEHAATREMLAGQVDQLRELLGAQGLVLSGMSVGGQAAGGGRGQADGGSAGRGTQARRAQDPATPAAEKPAGLPRRGAGTLDLYV